MISDVPRERAEMCEWQKHENAAAISIGHASDVSFIKSQVMKLHNIYLSTATASLPGAGVVRAVKCKTGAIDTRMITRTHQITHNIEKTCNIHLPSSPSAVSAQPSSQRYMAYMIAKLNPYSIIGRRV